MGMVSSPEREERGRREERSRGHVLSMEDEEGVRIWAEFTMG
jgi:hypothetical protein